MILVWLKLALVWLGRLVIPPATTLRRINESEYCPACGNRKGSIEFTRIASSGVNTVVGTPMVKHTCSICKFAWYERPVSVPALPAL